MDLSRDGAKQQQQQLQTLLKKKEMDAAAPGGVEDPERLLDVPLVQTSGYGIASILHAFSQKKLATSSTKEIMTSPLAPITPNKCQRIQDWQPVEVVHVVSEGSEKKGTLQTASFMDSLDVCIGNDSLLAPITPDKSRPIVDYQPHERDLSDRRLSEENDECIYVKVPLQVEQIKAHEDASVKLVETAQNGKEEEIGLIKTPRKSASKRKKHRPKVIQDDKPAKKPKPETPIPSENKENPTPKRVYVRRKKVLKTPSGADGESTDQTCSKGGKSNVDQLTKKNTKSVKRKPETPFLSENNENSTPKRVYVRRKKVLITPSGADRGSMDQSCLKGEKSNVDQLTKKNTKSVRRTLNFDFVSQEGDGCQLSPVTNVESRAQETFDGSNDSCETFAGSTDSCSTKIAVTLTQGLEVVLNKSPVGIAFDLNRALNQMLEEYIALPEHPITSAQTCTGDAVSEELKNFDDTNRMQTDQGQINSDNQSDVILIEDGTEERGMKKDCDHIEVTQHPSTYECLRDTRYMHVYKKRKETSKTHVKSSLSFYIPEIHKKRRTVKVKAWRCNEAMLSAFRDVSFADGQSSRTLDRLEDSELMLAISSIMRTTKKRSKIPTRARKPTSVDFVVDSNYLVETPQNLKESVVTSGSNKYRPPTCMEALFADTRYKLKTKRRTEKVQLHLVSSMPSNMKKEQEVTSFKFQSQSQHQQIVLGLTAPSTRSFSERILNHCQITSAQNQQLRSNILGPLCVSFQSQAIVPYVNDMDIVLHKLKCLNINGDKLATATEQNALSYYWGGSTMVPYQHLFGLVKKKRPRARVDLDPETSRVWKLLMGNKNVDGDADQDMDKEKWWEEERRIFRGRIDSFIARMHLIQGDRRFSKWKGSVVDSVVGVFLTQNVSDHLSSSAFMSLAARYPLSSRGDNKKSYPERTNMPKEERNGGTPVPDDANKWQEVVSTSEAYDLGSADIDDSGSLGSNSKDGLDNSVGENLHVDERDQPICLKELQNNTDTPLNVTGSTNLAEAEDRVSMVEVVSSQNSIVLRGNSLDTLTRTTSPVDSSLELITEADNLLIRSKCCSSDCSTLLREHKLIRETITSKESYNYDDEIWLAENWACTEAEKETTPTYMLDSSRSSSPSAVTSDNLLNYAQTDAKFVQPAASMSHNFHISSICGSIETGNIDIGGEGSCLPSTSFEFVKTYNTNTAEEFGSSTDQQILVPDSSIMTVDSHVSLSKQYGQTHNCSLINDVSDKPPRVQDMQTAKLQQEDLDFEPENMCHEVNILTQKQHQSEEPECPNSYSKLNKKLEASKTDKASWKDEVCVKKNNVEMKSSTSTKKMKAEIGKRNFDWDSLRIGAFANSDKRERSCEEMDSLDWEAVRCADVNEISKTIRERGMNNVLAGRIKDFLNRLVKDHGSIDLEWLRDVPPDKAKDYLLSVRGLGLKSVECVLLLTLHHLAFPVDTNVGRVCVRLGWVPLQPLPETLQLHLLELYPMIEHIQKYLWPRLCTLDQETLYELHYQMITFGKVFCTKSKPNCNACPMRGDCKHFASAFASARLSLPGPEEKRLVTSRVPIISESEMSSSFSSAPQYQIDGNLHQEGSVNNNSDLIIEEPPTPEQECTINLESTIEDEFYEDPDDIPIIKLNLEEFAENLQNYVQENNVEVEGGDMSKALVALTAEAASIPMPKLKNVSRLRTEHRVYELPDSHPLLEAMDQREHNDPCPYLLAIWTPGETAQSVEPPQSCCNFQSNGELCDRNTCFTCNSIREEHTQTVRGTLLIPCRTAMRGSFPLNGTYFQVNEVFADHTSSCKPIDVPREWIWNLPRRTVYFGTSIPTIFKGLTTEEIQLCFWRGFVCIRGFDRLSKAPKPLFARLHLPASKESNTRKMDPNDGQNNTSGTT